MEERGEETFATEEAQDEPPSPPPGNLMIPFVFTAGNHDWSLEGRYELDRFDEARL